MELDVLVKTYVALGAGGLALVVLIWLIVYQVTRINPVLESIKEDNKAHTEIIKNNTEAIKEVSRSNQNVASALSLLNLSFETFSKQMEKHDARAEGIENEIIKISTNVKHISKE